MNTTAGWLLEGPPWVVYRTLSDLQCQPEDDPRVLDARKTMLLHPKIQDILSALLEWPGTVLKSHKDANHLIHKLTFVADLGLAVGDPMVDALVDRILDHQAAEGPFQILVNIPKHFGGTGEDQWSWMLCDAPLVLYTLGKFGLDQDPRVLAAIEYLVSLIRENGWPCAASPVLGKFKGPGRKADPCPYANLVMLRMLAQWPQFRDDEVSRIGANALLTLWEQRRESRPYLFAMGTHFTYLKAPLIWYDILHVLEVLSQFPWLCSDDRLQEMGAIVRQKADEHGRFTPESIWRAWNEWDFGQKREPSRWLTLVAQKILKRIDN